MWMPHQQPFVHNNLQPHPQMMHQPINQATMIESLNGVNQQQQQQQQQQPPAEKALDTAYKRQEDGPILWFAGPPLNVIPDIKPLHSVAYLDWKKRNRP